MRILIFGPSKPGGGRGRMNAYRDFLSKKHDVSIIQIPGKGLIDRFDYFSARGIARLSDREKVHMRKTADFLEKKIRAGKYEAVIGVETPFCQVLTRDLGCLKIFSCESLAADELCFSKSSEDLNRVHSLRKMEIEILQKSDHVIFPWPSTEDYVRKYILNGKNFITVKYGCYPKTRKASYFFPVSIVSLGSVRHYWSNRELLGFLTEISPYAIHVYGNYKPPSKYKINYRGFAKSIDVLNDYQFGLNTVSKDPFRCNHHASRIMEYLSIGLPTLSPDWMQFSHELNGVIPFNETNFLQKVEENSDPENWEKLSQEAYDQAQELDWAKVLRPLDAILGKN